MSRTPSPADGAARGRNGDAADAHPDGNPRDAGARDALSPRDSAGADSTRGDANSANTLCKPVNAGPDCSPSADGGSACCAGTICTLNGPDVRCTHDIGGSCQTDADCFYVCSAAGVCTYPPKCAASSDDCTAPDVTDGCCDSLATCESSFSPARCCRAAGIACGAANPCCPLLTCSAQGVCEAPSCVPTHDNVDCSVFPGVPCCDNRLTCQVANGMGPYCCGSPGTVITADAGDATVCCYGTTNTAGVITCSPKP